jgi:serine/threonine protein kinase
MLNHDDLSDNLVQLHGCWKQDETYNILLEYVGGGTLADVFRRSHPTSKEDRLRFWSKLILVLNPVCRIHHHVDPHDESKVVEGYVVHLYLVRSTDSV